jgi:hypothetical protein
MGSSPHTHSNCIVTRDRLSIQCQTPQGRNEIKARHKSPTLCVLKPSHVHVQAKLALNSYHGLNYYWIVE